MSRIVVMGSGETAPTMVRVHREVFAAAPAGPAVLLDTPFSFQMNRDELVARTQQYFAQSVGRQVEVARWPRRDGDPAAVERALALLDQAAWAFAGPGSPTYALRQWTGTAVPGALAAVVRRGGTVVMGSAAALTLGSHTVPVYEIYKVGAEPAWVEGLSLLGETTGLHAAVIPHYDNAEGGTHDTRFCYLGEPRLAALEAQLPDEVGVLGVDEHTAAIFDLPSRTLEVRGNGVVSVRRRGSTTTFADGQRLGFDDLDALLRGERSSGTPAAAAGPTAPADAEPDVPATSLRAEAEACRAAFDGALAARDVAGCVQAVLALEQAIADWSADTLQSDDRDEARRVLRAMLVRLGDLATVGAADPRETLAPYVDLLLDLRASARDAKDFATSDLVRDRLSAAGVEVRDTPDGAEWVLPEGDEQAARRV
jgi:cyanophycinase-like exopeptidase